MHRYVPALNAFTITFRRCWPGLRRRCGLLPRQDEGRTSEGSAGMRVLIVGGGIGGLSLAVSLHAAGIDDVEVFEAAPAIEELGVGINVLPHAVRGLSELGLADDLSAQGLATGEFVMFNKHGQRIWGEPRGLAAGYRWPQYSIHRGRLLGVLHRAFVERLGETRLHTGHRVVNATQNDVSVYAHVAGGTRVGGDVLVGADGVHSAIRAQLHPGEGAPLWNGITMWRAVAQGEGDHSRRRGSRDSMPILY